MILWRISNRSDLTGEGGLRASGRWHTRGRRIVDCAQTPSAALLEIVVHLEVTVADMPVRYRLMKIEVPAAMRRESVTLGDLPRDWIVRPDLTRAIGDAWLSPARSPLLIVPSALVPETFNVLLNPGHQDASRVVVVDVAEHPIDPRLLV